MLDHVLDTLRQSPQHSLKFLVWYAKFDELSHKYFCVCSKLLAALLYSICNCLNVLASRAEIDACRMNLAQFGTQLIEVSSIKTSN